MNASAYANLRNLCTGIERIFASAVCAGIAPDARHRKRGGYHCTRTENPARNYSIVRRDDRDGQGPDNAWAAFDIGMNRSDMTTATRRLMLVWSNPNDPRRKYLNAFNGWLGNGHAYRYDVVARRSSRATPDHKWHLHCELRRLYVLSGTAVKAILSALRGETVSQYLTSIGVKADPPSRGPVRVAVPRYPGRVLRVGNDRPDAAVRAWQRRMIARGWTSIGKDDGLFGPKVETVVRRYQKLCKVSVDGQIGPQTWPLPWRPIG